MRHLFFAAVAVFNVGSGVAAMAYEAPRPQKTDTSAYLDRQAASSELADPTAPHSVRSHGRQ